MWVSQDLDIYHNTHSYIENDTGHLYISNHESNSSSIFLTLKEVKNLAYLNTHSECLFKGTVGGALRCGMMDQRNLRRLVMA